MNKKLYRSNTQKMIAGIFGGLGEYFNVDPTLLRVVWILFTVITGIVPGVIIYLLVWIVVPRRPLDSDTEKREDPMDPRHSTPDQVL